MWTAFAVVIGSMLLAAGAAGVAVVLVTRWDWMQDDGADGR